jgi:hypothetical protein
MLRNHCERYLDLAYPDRHYPSKENGDINQQGTVPKL